MSTAMYAATGRRKTAVARVTLTAGGGTRKVNNRDLKDYFPRPTLLTMIEQPLRLTGLSDKYDVVAKTTGGGVAGQAGAVRLGIARAILKIDEGLRKTLKKNGLLTRDPRMVERKKYGQPKARKRFQFSKR